MARINAPVRQPWFGVFVNSLLTKRFGKGFPALTLLGHHPGYPVAYSVFSSVFGTGRTKLPEQTRRLSTQLVAQLNGCAFCIDLGQRFAQDQRHDFEKITRVVEFQTRPELFSAAELAALQYAFEATQVGARVSDSTFAELKKHCDDREILELTVAVATENFYNRLNAPLEIESQGFCTILSSAPNSRTA
jgi:alkylhydroperoxidase family enzyme